LSEPIEILDHLADCQLLLVIDACHTGAAPGSIFRFEWPKACFGFGRANSTHRLGLTASLELAAALGQLPKQVILFAVEIHNADPGGALTPAVQTAVAELSRKVLAEVDQYRRRQCAKLAHVNPANATIDVVPGHKSAGGSVP
jgi:hydrogenase maturation protease